MNLNDYQTTPLITHKITQIHPFQLISNSSTLNTEHSREPFIDRANMDNKKIIPVKQYSNKFLRQTKIRQEICMTKMNLKRRLNLVVKKKQFLNRTNFKQNSLKNEENPTQQKSDQQCFMKVNRLSKSHYRTKRIATENPQTNHQSVVINQLQNQIVLNTQSLYSNVSNLHMIPVNLFHANERFKSAQPKERDQGIKKNNIVSPNQQDVKQKISQSRGLELYSKIFIRNRSQMIQKMRIQSCKSRKKQMISKMSQVEQNFEAKRITPIQKIRKVKNVSVSGGDRFFNKKNTHCVTDNEECFEINAWETTL